MLAADALTTKFTKSNRAFLLAQDGALQPSVLLSIIKKTGAIAGLFYNYVGFFLLLRPSRAATKSCPLPTHTFSLTLNLEFEELRA
jgi:hypothetical protein